MGGTPSAAASHIVEWMVDQALATTTVPDAFKGLIDHLRNEGIAVDRSHLAYTTLHPLHRGTGATWSVATGMEVEHFDFDRDQNAAGWYTSPIHHAIKHGIERMRRRLSGPAAMLDFPVLEGFASEGLTDYLLLCCPFDGVYGSVDLDDGRDVRAGAGLIISFATARPSGFTEAEIDTLHWLLKPFATVVKVANQHQIACNLADCYIGREAGPRVLNGAIQRGDFASTPAVVWLSDLRASTEMSVSMPREEFIATINEFFDCTAGAVEAEGGEPLTFIGDGALAIFPIDRMGEVGAREAAIAAAERATEALAAMNRARVDAGKAPIGWGIALHAGVLEYGNIGSATRHSWSAIGAVVNETARLEGTTKLTGEAIVASRAFVDHLAEPWREMGSFDLRGVPGKFEVFAPPVPAETKAKEEAA
ncbi:MAG: adenylate/guanylate cyclase domain-containing protein [Pseudomonadota bacterium]